MSTMRCPKCKLINGGNARRCRRCGTPISSATGYKPLNLNPGVRNFVIALIAIISLTCIYGFYRHSKDVSTSHAGLAGKDNGPGKNVPANRGFEEVKKLKQDFMACIDQNTASPESEGLNKNQTLAFETLTHLQEQQAKVSDPAMQEYLNEFQRLVKKYYSQLARYKSQSDHRQEAKPRTGRTRFRNLAGLSQADRWNENAGGDGLTTADDIDETVKAIRNLSPIAANAIQ